MQRKKKETQKRVENKMEESVTVIEEFSLSTDASNDHDASNSSVNHNPIVNNNNENNNVNEIEEKTNDKKIDNSMQASIRPRTSSTLQRGLIKCTKKYQLKLPCSTMQDAENNEGILKRISWRRPGKYFLRTDKPKLLSFRNNGPDNNQIEYQDTGFDDEKTYIRLNFANIQSFMRANILVFIHRGEPPECPDSMSPDIFVPKYYEPVETLLFEVTYTLPEDVGTTYINWKKIRNETKFSYIQLSQLYDQFMYDTRQSGHCGVLRRDDFGRILRNFSLVDISENELNNLWMWFDKDTKESHINFETFATRLGQTWHDVHFFGLSAAAREALKEEKKYEEINEQDKKAREQAIHNMQLQDVEKAYSRLTGSPIPPSPSFVASSQKQRTRGHSTLSQVSSDPRDGNSSNESLLEKLMAVSDDKIDNGNVTNNEMKLLLQEATGTDGNIINVENASKSETPKTPPRLLGIPPSSSGIKSPRGIRVGDGVNFSKDQVESKLQNAYDTVMKKKMKDDDDGDEEDIRDDNNDGVNDDDNISKIYGSPDRSLASLYKDHPLARTFVRACSMSPMTPELMDSLANAFANELAESAMFKTDASPVIPALDLTKLGDSTDEDDHALEEKEDEETQKEALELAMDIAQEKARRAFKKYDKDGKNGIDRKEFKQVCIDLGVAASRKERKEAIKLLDTDGSGTIGEKEFVAWYGELVEAEVNAEANGGSSTDETDSGDFVPSALKDDKNEESMDISKVANLVNTSARGKSSTWVGNLIVTVHSANELIISANANPSVNVSFLDLAPDIDDTDGGVHPHEDTNYSTPPCHDAVDVRWDAKDATFKIEKLLTIPDMDSNETPKDVDDLLPLYGNGEIQFKVDCGLEAGIIGTAKLNLIDLHGNICNVIESDKDNIENHGLTHHSIDLKPPIHLRTTSLDGIGNLEVTAIIEFKRKKEEKSNNENITGTPTSSRKGVREGFGEHESAEVADKLRKARRASGIKVTDLFKSMDEEKKGTISREAFTRAIISLGADVSEEEAGLVFDHFDEHGHGRMMYADYVKMMMSAPIEPVKTLTEKRKEERMIEKSKQREKERLMEKVNLQAMVARIRTERRKREILPQSLYDLFDKDNSGAISKDEMVDALKSWNFSHTDDEINAVYAVYAGDDGLMDYSEFLTFITGGTSKSGKRVKRAVHPNHRPAGDMQNDGAITTDEEDDEEHNDDDGGGEYDEDDEELEAEKVMAKAKKLREKRQKRFMRQRSLAFAVPETSYVQMTIYGADNLALNSKGNEPRNPVVHIKAVGLRSKKISTKKGSTRSPTWNFKTEIGKNNTAGIGKLRKFNLKVKDGTRILGVVDIDFNITQFSRSTEERMKHPLSKHDDQKMFEKDDDTLGFIDVGIKVISKEESDNKNTKGLTEKKSFKDKRPEKIITEQ